MKFIVIGTNQTHLINQSCTAYLVEDQWDDWFQYSTMYDLYITDKNNEKQYIGKVKIGQWGMKDDQRRPNIPKVFNQLDDSFFSLGQDDYYYERIKDLGYEFRAEILNNLNDIALNEALYENVKSLNVTRVSLQRDISSKTIIEQFRRIANGGARLTKYSFQYTSSVIDPSISPMELSFDVIPESNPPTNIHVLIGRNGVGKTHLIKNMINSIVRVDAENTSFGCFSSDGYEDQIFSKVVFVSLSAFDELIEIESPKIPYIAIVVTPAIKICS